MEKNKIEFILEKFEKALCFQITKQSIITPEFRENLYYFDGYTIKINADLRPDIEISFKSIKIWVRGSDFESGNDIITKVFYSNEQRDKVYELILESFRSLGGKNGK